MLVNSPHLPNIEAIADTSRGKLSVHLDLDRAQEREALGALVSQARVFVQGYRPGALAARGFDTEALIRRYGARVRIAVAGKRGKIEIDFGSPDELERILGVLKGD
jgi:hypothetical protein